jgi:hypothetical protein
MQGSERQAGATQAIAWLGVIGVHACLLWLLTRQAPDVANAEDGPRLRLVFVTPARPLPPPVLHPRSSSVPPIRTPRDASIARRPAVVLSAPAERSSEPAPSTADQLQQQGREWAARQASPTFATDPFSSRRAQLPGGDGRGRFRMKEPLSPQKILQKIGGMAGGPGYSQSPCPRIASNLSGLLTAASVRERELLDEELRRDREYCRP